MALSADENMDNRNFHALPVGMQTGLAPLEDNSAFLTKPNVLLPYNPTTVFLGI